MPADALPAPVFPQHCSGAYYLMNRETLATVVNGAKGVEKVRVSTNFETSTENFHKSSQVRSARWRTTSSLTRLLPCFCASSSFSPFSFALDGVF